MEFQIHHDSEFSPRSLGQIALHRAVGPFKISTRLSVGPIENKHDLLLQLLVFDVTI
jgi:hypothetical protein